MSPINNAENETYIRIIVGPSLSELVIDFIVEEPRLLHLRVIVALEYNSYEKLQEYQTDYEVVADEECIG